MVAPQSRTLVRYQNMIARQPPTPLGCVVVLAHEASPANEGVQARSCDVRSCTPRRPPLAVNRGRGLFAITLLRSQALSREHASFPFLLPLEYLMALAESGGLGLPPARILVA